MPSPRVQSATRETENRQRKTRKRLRVSCVECTRRRQKCDRSQPCGLCRRRGVEHLCRWELEPFARPLPSRPSTRKSQTQNGSQASAKRGESSSASLQSANVLGPDITLEREVKDAAIALAQLSVARHGEYLGTGSLVCALHNLNDTSETKVTLDKSSALPFSTNSRYSSAVSAKFNSMLRSCMSDFGTKSSCDALISSFFEHDNWRYGLPETLLMSIYNSMWDTIHADQTSIERINLDWMTVLFAILALSSGCSSEEESRKYFLQALTARRLTEDLQSASFFAPRDPGTFSQGTAHGCIAASLMADYMCDRGQMTEAWKMIGSAVRNAQNAGLHLNPAWSRWKDMTEDEQTLRTLAWHLCAERDRFLSFALGRPGMVRSREYYVPIQETYPSTLASDGSSNVMPVYQACLIRLIENVSEEKDKYLSVHPDPSDGRKSFDSKLATWEASLPTYLALRDPDTTHDHIYPKVRMQRHLIACFYLFCCMLFHRSVPSVKLMPGAPDEVRYKQRQWEFSRLTRYATDLIHAQRSFLEILGPQRQICFTTTYFIFEAAVTLSIAIRRDSGNSLVDEWRKERDAAIDLLQSVLDMDNSELTQQAIVVLRIIQDKRACSTGDTSAEASQNPSEFSWLFLEPQYPQYGAMQAMFPIDAFRSLAAASEGGDEAQSGIDNGFGFSAFDFLFNAGVP